VALLGIDWRAWRSAAPRLILTAAVLLAVLLPLINYTLDNPGNFSRRLDQTFIFDAATSDGHAPAPLVEQNARLIAGMWNEHGDENGRHNLSGAPMLDPLSGVAFVAGACLLLARLRDRRAQIVLIWLGVMLIPGLLSGQAPHAARTVEAIAPTILLAAVGGAALLDWALRERGWIANASLRWGVALGLLACVLALNGWRYFVAWPATPPAYLEFYVGQTHIGEAAQQLARAPELNRYQVFVSANLDDSDVIDYLTFGSDVRKFDGSRLWLGPGDQALLILRGNRPADDQARRILGAGALMIGEGPRSPVSGRPEFVIYARDAAAAPAVARVLARLLAAAPWS